MNIHEYQAKELLAKYGVPVQPGGVAYTAAEAEAVATRLGGKLWAVKAQIHAGGRGKAGGVQLVRSAEEAGVGQGGRRQAGARAGESRCGGGRHARQASGDAPDRAAGPRRQARLYRSQLRY